MSFKFEKLIIWQDAMSFGEKIFTFSKGFPDDGCRMFLKGFLMRIQYCLPPMAVITLLSVTVNLQKTHTDYKDCADFRLR
jgi:hypothetical protein